MDNGKESGDCCPPAGAVLVRDFRQDDELEAIALDLIETYGFCPMERRTVKRMCKDARQHSGGILIAAIPGPHAQRVIGYLLYLPKPRWLPWKTHTDVAKLAVHPEFRRIGAGRLLMESCMRLSQKAGISTFTLMVRRSNSRARNLYESLGFTVVGALPRYYPDEDGLSMLCRRQV